jgi:ATP-binding cassette subfamily F protein uup
LTLRRALAPTGDTVTFRDRNEHISAWAKRFLFHPDQLDRPIKSMSGGEQARILIARLMLRPADVLLLDEPTNDLDIPSLEVLEESLSDFPGALVLVTHDRYMIQRLATDILGLDGCGGARLFSSFEQWENARDEAEREEAKARKDAAKLAKKDGGKSAKRLSFKEQQEWDAMESKILESEETMQRLHTQLEAPELAGNPRKLQELCTELADAQARVDGLYARWQELEAKQIGASD